MTREEAYEILINSEMLKPIDEGWRVLYKKVGAVSHVSTPLS